jgi:hypothetical protein
MLACTVLEGLAFFGCGSIFFNRGLHGIADAAASKGSLTKKREEGLIDRSGSKYSTGGKRFDDRFDFLKVASDIRNFQKQQSLYVNNTITISKQEGIKYIRPPSSLAIHFTA